MEELARRLNAMEVKFDAMNNEKIQALITALAVQKEKTNKLENIVYGLLTMVVAQLIGFVFLYIKSKSQ